MGTEAWLGMLIQRKKETSIMFLSKLDSKECKVFVLYHLTTPKKARMVK